MRCRDCPYGREDFERRMYWYQKIVNERGIPNDIFHYLEPEDAPDQFEQFLWCDKVGGKVYCFGHCTDAIPMFNKIDKSSNNVKYNEHYRKQKRRDKRNRDLKYKNHVKFLAQTVQHYPHPAMPVNEYGRWNFDDPVGTVYYRRVYKENRKKNRSKFYKKCANRSVRRYKGEIGNGCTYKKYFDYAWEVY